MKKILLLAAITFLGISAFAQSSSTNPKVKNQDKEQTDLDKEDSTPKLTDEQKVARKAEKRSLKDAEKAQRRASKEIRKAEKKADRDDDGLLNESNVKNDSHGKEVSAVAKETTLEGKEKGKAVSTAANSKAGNVERVKRNASEKAVKNKKPAKIKKSRS
jgi:hypothetical protein